MDCEGRFPLEPWNLLSSCELLARPPWIRVHMDKVRLPSGRVIKDYYRVELPEYVMVYANAEGRILFQRQYRHALGAFTLTMPTGCVEEGESPLDAAKREFLEETGYTAKDWRRLGSFVIDGSKGCGKAHFFAAEGIRRVADPVRDDMEESELLFLSEPEALHKVYSGGISLISVATLILMTSSGHALEE